MAGAKVFAWNALVMGEALKGWARSDRAMPLERVSRGPNGSVGVFDVMGRTCGSS